MTKTVKVFILWTIWAIIAGLFLATHSLTNTWLGLVADVLLGGFVGALITKVIYDKN